MISMEFGILTRALLQAASHSQASFLILALHYHTGNFNFLCKCNSVHFKTAYKFMQPLPQSTFHQLQKNPTPFKSLPYPTPKF